MIPLSTGPILALLPVPSTMAFTIREFPDQWTAFLTTGKGLTYAVCTSRNCNSSLQNEPRTRGRAANAYPIYFGGNKRESETSRIPEHVWM